MASVFPIGPRDILDRISSATPKGPDRRYRRLESIWRRAADAILDKPPLASHRAGQLARKNLQEQRAIDFADEWFASLGKHVTEYMICDNRVCRGDVANCDRVYAVL